MTKKTSESPKGSMSYFLISYVCLFRKIWPPGSYNFRLKQKNKKQKERKKHSLLLRSKISFQNIFYLYSWTGQQCFLVVIGRSVWVSTESWEVLRLGQSFIYQLRPAPMKLRPFVIEIKCLPFLDLGHFPLPLCIIDSNATLFLKTEWFSEQLCEKTTLRV